MNQFKNKVLYIESNEMLEEVRELIEKSGKKEILPKEVENASNTVRYMYYSNSPLGSYFRISKKCSFEYEITLEEFKELLKQ